MILDEEFSDIAHNLMKEGHEYDEAYGLARDIWIAEKRYKDLYTVITYQYEFNHTKLALPFLEALLKDDEIRLYKSYWKGCLRYAIEGYWNKYDYWKSGIGYHQEMATGKRTEYRFEVEISTQKFLSYDIAMLKENEDKYPSRQDGYLSFVWDWRETLNFIDIFIEAMQKINANDEIEKAKLIKKSIYNFEKPKPKKTTDRRKIDERLFWELIITNHKDKYDNSEFLEQLQNQLETFSPTEIKKFQKILLEKIDALYHWDIWALAYIVRRGCGDDEFDYFRAWVVSQGEEVFNDVKAIEYDILEDVFSKKEPQLEEFMYIAVNAYENKTGEIMSQPRIKKTKIQGEKWMEEDLCMRYSKLCKIFDYNM